MKFPSNLNCDGKIVSEMGPTPVYTNNATVSTRKTTNLNQNWLTKMRLHVCLCFLGKKNLVRILRCALREKIKGLAECRKPCPKWCKSMRYILRVRLALPGVLSWYPYNRIGYSGQNLWDFFRSCGQVFAIHLKFGDPQIASASSIAAIPQLMDICIMVSFTPFYSLYALVRLIYKCALPNY